MNLELHKKIISKLLSTNKKLENDFDEQIIKWYDKEIMPNDKRGINEIIFEDIHVHMVGHGKITPSKADKLYKDDIKLYWSIIHDIARFDLGIINCCYDESNDDPNCERCNKYVDERSLQFIYGKLICPSCATDTAETEVQK